MATSTSVRLDDEFLESVRPAAKTYRRSIPKQIEHWSEIGKVAEQNPSLTYHQICELIMRGKS